jgi:hypothetical protein
MHYKDYQSRLALCLRDMFVDRSDWLYWVKARVLSEYAVKPGEEIIRFVSAGSSNRSHRHMLRFKSHDTKTSLTNAEKGLHYYFGRTNGEAGAAAAAGLQKRPTGEGVPVGQLSQYLCN